MSMHTEKLAVERLEGSFVLKDRIYEALKRAIMSMDVYATSEERRLDERQLSEDLGVSRTPIREALCRLEQEGFVRTVPRKGAYVARKSKEEIIDIVTVWAALESMAARLITVNASDEAIGSLRRMFATFKDAQVEAKIDEYSETNIRFHQAIVGMCGCVLLKQMAENLFIHMRWIRMRTIGEDDRASRSIIDHMHIIEALEGRETKVAERLVREHALSLAEHVRKNIDYLD